MWDLPVQPDVSASASSPRGPQVPWSQYATNGEFGSNNKVGADVGVVVGDEVGEWVSPAGNGVGDGVGAVVGADVVGATVGADVGGGEEITKEDRSRAKRG